VFLAEVVGVHRPDVGSILQLVLLLVYAATVLVLRPFKEPKRTGGTVFVLLTSCLAVLSNLLYEFGQRDAAAVLAYLVTAMLFVFIAGCAWLLMWLLFGEKLWALAQYRRRQGHGLLRSSSKISDSVSLFRKASHSTLAFTDIPSHADGMESFSELPPTPHTRSEDQIELQPHVPDRAEESVEPQAALKMNETS
jgi:hypothetical protein